MVPALARMAFGLNRSVRGEAAITASAPAPSAERRIAPRLPGFSTASTHDDERVLRQAELGRAPRTGSGRPPPGPRRAVRRRAWRRPLSLTGWGGIAAAAQLIERAAARPGPARSGSQTNASTTDDPGLEGAAELAGAVDQGQAGSIALATLAQGRRGLDPRVGEAGQDRQGRGGHRRHHAPPVVRAKAPSSRTRPSDVGRRPGRRASIRPASPSETRPSSELGQAVAVEPRRVRRQEHEPVGLEDAGAGRQQARQVLLQPPWTRPRARARSSVGRARSRRTSGRGGPRAR